MAHGIGWTVMAEGLEILVHTIYFYFSCYSRMSEALDKTAERVYTEFDLSDRLK